MDNFGLALVSTDAPMRPRHGEARGRILRAFDDLLRDRAAATISADDVAVAAGVSRRTVFNQFAGMAALYRESREALLHDAMRRLPREMPGSAAPSDAVAALLVDLAGAFAAPAQQALLLSLFRDREAGPWLADLYREWVWLPCVRLVQLQLIADGAESGAARAEAEALVRAACALACGHCPPCADSQPADCDRVASAVLAFARPANLRGRAPPAVIPAAPPDATVNIRH